MSSALGLNEHHQNNVVNYMRFARYQRGQRLRAVDACFNELKDSRLVEDTFTIDEVTDMLDGLLSVVRSEVESELINTSHTNILLLRQLFQQAEKWHLKLQADISELENRDLLDAIKEFEESEFAGTTLQAKFQSRLEPLNESGGSALLQMEIERMSEENDRLKDRLRQVESRAIDSQSERSRLKADLDSREDELRSMHGRRSDTSGEDVEHLRRQIGGLKTDMEKGEASRRRHADGMEDDLAGTKHELLKIREMLEMAEKELEKKVSQTAPYRNLKQMLQKKNEQLKDFRRRLERYEDPDD